MVTIRNKISGVEETMDYAIFRSTINKDLWNVIRFDDIAILYSVSMSGKKSKGQVVELEHAKDLHSKQPNSISYEPYSFDDYKHDAKLAEDKRLGRTRINYPSNQPVKPKVDETETYDFFNSPVAKKLGEIATALSEQEINKRKDVDDAIGGLKITLPTNNMKDLILPPSNDYNPEYYLDSSNNNVSNNKNLDVVKPKGKKKNKKKTSINNFTIVGNPNINQGDIKELTQKSNHDKGNSERYDPSIKIPHHVLVGEPSPIENKIERKVFFGISIHPDLYNILVWIAGIIGVVLSAYIIFKAGWL